MIESVRVQLPSAAARPARSAAAPRSADPSQVRESQPEAQCDLASLSVATQPRCDWKSRIAATSASAQKIQSELAEHYEGEVLVKLKPGLNLDGMSAFVDEYGCSLVEHFEIPQCMRSGFQGELIHLKVPANVSTAEAMAVLADDPRVAYAGANDVLKALDAAPVVPNDLSDKLWGMNQTNDIDIDAPEAWATSTGSKQGPVICVIDTGIDYNHPDLRNNIWTNPGEIPGNGIDDDGNGVIDDVHGYNAITDGGDPLDDHNHGTHCAGTIAGEGNNGQGVVGVNWNAQVMGAKFLSASGSGSTAGAIKAVLYASKMGARITSNSWGGGGFSQALMDTLQASPALHIFAAGNEHNDNDKKPSYPASYQLPNIISVAAHDRNDRLASFSNYGATSVDIAAPGVDIYSTLRGGGYGTMSGTSMACPHVAGVAGLLAATYPEATNEQLKNRILSGAVPVSNYEGKVATGGRLNAANSIQNDTTAPAAPADPTFTATSSHTAEVGWVAPGDDGLEGKASGYQFRFSDRPIVDGPAGQGQTAFADATPIATPAPGPSGSREQFSINLPRSTEARHLYLGVKAYDNAGNTSPLTSLEADVPGPIVPFQDDAESGPGKWTTTGDWAVADEPGRGKVWTDSPGGPYTGKRKTSLISNEFSLKDLKESSLRFDAKFELAEGDRVRLEVHNGGWFWKNLAAFEGKQDWHQEILDMSSFDNDGKIKLRFTLDSKEGGQADGFSIDNLQVTADPGAAQKGGCLG